MAQIPTEQDRQNLKAKKFLVWLFIVSSFILFAGFTSGFIVYTAGSPNRGIKTILPHTFIYSTAIIILSSVTMHLAYLSGKRLQFGKQKLFLVLTILLGIAFFYAQLTAWGTLIKQGVYFINYNASQSFIYVFTGMHLLHIFAGLIMVLTALIGKIRNISQVRNMFRLETTSIFWHFIDILWIYIYVFLLLNQ
ncbi:heme-copper oxidase subunit III [Pedobacter sp. BS3]|uniref:cytochrome c oxidase subunit 3 n=1 Tax=Pedobacter sp. BS3 TaxID=2567937 RepID=UPI001659A2B7|nr:cytochrome c oxidase subunit 3 [Pedobacter sp. BS3]